MSYLTSTYTGTDVSNYVKRQFGDESGVQITDEDIVHWINAGINEIFRKNEPIKAIAQADVTVDVSEYTFPPDVFKVQSILYNGVPLEQKTYQEVEEYLLREDPQNSSRGNPQLWYEWGGSFIVWPAPDKSSVGGLKIRYVKAPTKLNDISEPLPLPHPFYNRLIEYVLSQAYELDENWTATSLKTQQFSQNLESQINQDSTTANTYATITVLEEDL